MEAHMNAPSPFQVGTYRPIYLWGGPGTIRMNRLKFMDTPVNEQAHEEVHTAAGAQRVTEGLYCNWVHLMYDWGFPSEVEEEDWDSFAHAAGVYHRRGSPVFAYIQASNCVYAGSYRDRNWYARDPHERMVPYFTYPGRYMTCLARPSWMEHLKSLVRGAIARGADGIFFDNLFQGAQPLSLGGTWLGAVGCHCSLCQRLYAEEMGRPIPNGVDPRDPAVARYLRWRADQVTRLVAEVSATARELQPGTPISANDFDAVLRDSYLAYGIDLGALARVQDVVMIENYALPCWEREPQRRLANNALNVRTARAVVGTDAHLSVLSYDAGIGFDPVYGGRRYRQGIAEAAACGVSMTTKGTEYFDGRQMTMLTAAEYAALHDEIGTLHRWLEAHAALYAGVRRNLAPVALLYPGEALWLDWHHLAPLYFGAGQALTAAGIPWCVLLPGQELGVRAHGHARMPLRALLTFDTSPTPADLPLDVRMIHVPALAGWAPPRPLPLVERATMRPEAGRAAEVLLGAYSQNRLARRLMDRAGLPRLITQTPLYHVPEEAACRALLGALPGDMTPRLRAPEPALIEAWEVEDGVQLHLTNYAGRPQRVRVTLGAPAAGHTLSPDGPGMTFEGRRFNLPLDVYTVVELRELDANDEDQDPLP
jgi:hypothetical protein